MRFSGMRCYCRRTILPYLLLLALNASFYLVLYMCTSEPLPLSPTQSACQCTTPVVVTCATPPPTAPSLPPSTRASVTSREHYLLLALVLTSPKGKERRDIIRHTWMKGYREKRHRVLVKFAIGTYNLTSTEMKDIQTEEDTHHDLLLLPDLKDSYFNLTRKVLDSFIALHAKFNFSYLLKCDDDTFILLDTVLAELAQRTSSEAYYWGFFDGRAHVKRQGKWAEKKWFLCDRYLPYALGGGYVVSHDLVRRIVVNADGLAFYNSEDVSVGVWLSPYEAERRHDVRFNTEFVSRGCRNQYIVSHKQSVEDMVSKHKLLDRSGVQCEREYQTRMSYVYNWTTDPTKCCERRKGVP